MDAEVDQAKVEQIARWLGTGSINIFGWPFSGKDTQGKQLAKLFNAQLIGSGEILRNTSDLDQKSRQATDQGFLAPMQDFLKIVPPYLSRPEFNHKPLILSSIGRWHGEEETIMTAAKQGGHPIKAVVNLEMSEEIAKQRAINSQKLADRGQRADDSTEFFTTRVNEFKTKTLPVIDFYRQKGLLIEIDGSLIPEEVTKQIINKLYDFSTK